MASAAWKPADPAQRLTITLVLRPPAASAEIGQQLLAGTYDVSAATQASLAADPADVQAVVNFIQESGLQLVREDADARTIQASGTVAQLESAFGISLGMSVREDGSSAAMSYRGAITLPEALNGPVMAVLGLDQRPIARHHEAGAD